MIITQKTSKRQTFFDKISKYNKKGLNYEN